MGNKLIFYESFINQKVESYELIVQESRELIDYIQSGL